MSLPFEKVILTAGAGECPPAGATVEVDYVGTFPDGKEFDSSVKRGKHFSFKLGAGQVIKGWDLAVATMKKGEKCKITLPADYAYGARGAGGVIPPNATLCFDVELYGWQ